MIRRPAMFTPCLVLLALVVTGSIMTSSASSNGSRQRPKSSSISSRPASAARPSSASRHVTAHVQTASGHATYGYSHYRPGSGYGYGYGYSGYPYYWFSPWFWGPSYFYWGYPSPGYQFYSDHALQNMPLTIETDVKPGRASLSLDGEAIGRAKDFNGTWDLLAVSGGRHMLEFNKQGFMTLRISLDGKPGNYIRIKEKLVKGDGLDPRSSSSEPQPAPAVTPQTETPSGELRTGFLKIQASPPGAAIYLDGDFLASADELSRLHGALPLALGHHLVEVVMPGYASRTLSVVVEGEAPVEVVLALEALAD
jgi:hypothetical protein